MSMKKGVSRGIFSNEAGLGTGSIAHACADTRKPVKQGFFGIFEVFVDTIVICTLTALVILCSQVPVSYGRRQVQSLQSVDLPQHTETGYLFLLRLPCAVLHFPPLSDGDYTDTLHRVLVRFPCQQAIYASVCAGCHHRSHDGSGSDVEHCGNLYGLMAIPNLIAVFLLSGVVVKLVKEYFAGDGAKS